MALITLGGRSRAAATAPRADRAVLVACLLLVSVATAGDAVTTREITFGGVEVLAVACAALLLSAGRLATVTVWAWVGQAACVAAGALSVETAALDALSTGVAAGLIGVVARSLGHRQAHGDPVARAATAARPLPVAAATAEALRSRGLTRRECEVVALALSGFSADQIGTRLFIGRRTVETHLGRAYSKFGVHSRAGLAEELFAAEAVSAR